jgi:hypothetical protein
MNLIASCGNRRHEADRLRDSNIDRPRDRPLVSRRMAEPSHPRGDPHHLGGRNEGPAESDGASPRSHLEGEPEQPRDFEPEEEEIGAVPSTPFIHPRSANDHVHVAVPNPFRR